MDAMLTGTVSTAIQSICRFHAMTDYTAAAMGTRGGKRMNRAFEAVKNMRFATHPHLKTFIVSIAAYFTGGCLLTQHTFIFVHHLPLFYDLSRAACALVIF